MERSHKKVARPEEEKKVQLSAMDYEEEIKKVEEHLRFLEACMPSDHSSRRYYL